MKKKFTTITGVSSFLLWGTMLLFSASYLSSCSDDEEPAPTLSIRQIIEDTEGLDSLFALLELENNAGNPVFSGVIIELQEANITFFAPNNTAFAKLVEAVGVNSVTELRFDIVRDILMYHIVNSQQPLRSNQLTGDLETELDNETISANGTTLNEATQPDDTPTIVTSDLRATNNGIVHVIDNVLLPASVTTDIAPAFGTLAGFISMAGGLGDMNLLIRQAGLMDELANASTQYTVLGILDGVLNVSNLTEEQAQIIAGYHIIPGNPFEETILPSEVPTLLTDDPIYVYENPDAQNPDLSILLNLSAILLDPEYNTFDNGKVYIPLANSQSGLQPSVLSPSAFRNTGYEYVEAYGGTDEGDDLTLLFQAVNRVPAVKEILEGTERYTFFAPNDSAFAAANISADSLDLIPVATLEAILMNHFVSGVIFSHQLVGTTKATLKGNNVAFTEVDDSIVLTDQSTQKTATIIYNNFLGDVGIIHDVNRLLVPE